MTADAFRIPDYVARWHEQLPAVPLSQAVTDPARAAVFAADMVIGFCKHGNLASNRVGGLIQPVVELFQRAHAYGVGHFVLLQDTHHPAAPEFQNWPVHCVQGTEESKTVPELQSLPFARRFTVIEKNSLHPGLNTQFDQWLEAYPALNKAIVVGNCTDLCVYALAMHLRLRANAHNQADLEVIIPANAVETYDLPGETAQKLGAPAHPGDFFHQVFLYHMALNGITVVRELTASGLAS